MPDRRYRDRAWLHQQYLVLGRTQRQIAQQCGVTRKTVRTWVVRHGISKPYENYEWLRQRYVVCDMSVSEIASEIGARSAAVKDRVDKYGLDKPHHDPQWLKKRYYEGWTLKEIASHCGVRCDTLEDRLLQIDLPKRKWKTRDWLHKMHHRHQYSLTEMADAANVAKSTIQKWMSRTGVSRRPKHEFPLPPHEYGSFLRQHYIERCWSALKIAGYCNVSEGVILDRLEKFGIDRRPHTDRQAQMRGQLPGRGDCLRDREWVNENYVQQSCSLSDIAGQLHIGLGAVANWVRHHGFDIRSLPPRIDDPEWLRTEYHEKRRTLKEIAEDLGCTEPPIRHRMEEFGIKRRTPTKSRRVCSASNGRLLDAKWMEDRWNQSGSLDEIAGTLDCSRREVYKWLRHHQIIFPGSKPRNYGSLWGLRRAEARNRDGHECQNCGLNERKHKEETGLRLDVHHIQPFRSFLEDDGSMDKEAAHDLTNLITLCRSCHRILEKQPEKCRVLREN